MNDKKIILSGKNIEKIYDNVSVLTKISLELYQGDFTVIMGPSGSGKSTLLYCLSGMEQVTKGEIFCGSKKITNASEQELSKLRADEFGFVFQKTHLVSNLTLYENIIMAGFIHSKLTEKQVKENAENLIFQMRLQEAKDRLPSQVSGGEAQRAAVARAVIGKPSLLFADEPTGALNKANTEEVLNLFTEIHHRGQNILLVTHDKEAALRGNRILYLEDGAIISELELSEYEKRDRVREKTLTAWLETLGW